MKRVPLRITIARDNNEDKSYYVFAGAVRWDGIEWMSAEGANVTLIKPCNEDFEKILGISLAPGEKIEATLELDLSSLVSQDVDGDDGG